MSIFSLVTQRHSTVSSFRPFTTSHPNLDRAGPHHTMQETSRYFDTNTVMKCKIYFF